MRPFGDYGRLVVDLPAVCDGGRGGFRAGGSCFRCQTDRSRCRESMIVTQHNVYERIRHKTTLVANKGARIPEAHVSLPFVQSGDAMSVCRVLAGTDFGG